MNPKQRMLAIKLSEKIANNSEYAKNIGVEISTKKAARKLK